MDIQIANEMEAVKKLPFVSAITTYDRGELVVVALAAELTKYLPENRRAINFRKHDFNRPNVIEAYKSLILSHLNKGVTITKKVLAECENRINVPIL